MEGGSNAGFEAAEASSLNEVNENDFRCISSQLLCICSVVHGAQDQMTNESNLNTQLRTRRKLDRRITTKGCRNSESEVGSKADVFNEEHVN